MSIDFTACRPHISCGHHVKTDGKYKFLNIYRSLMSECLEMTQHAQHWTITPMSQTDKKSNWPWQDSHMTFYCPLSIQLGSTALCFVRQFSVKSTVRQICRCQMCRFISNCKNVVLSVINIFSTALSSCVFWE